MRSQTQNDSAKYFLDQSVVISQRLESPNVLYANYNSLALILQRTNEYEEAINIYHQIISVSDSLGDVIREVGGYSNLAALLMDQGDAQRALPYLKEVENMYEELPQEAIERNQFESYLTLVYTNFGQCYQTLDSVDIARRYFDKAYNFLSFVTDDYSKIYYKSFIDYNVNEIEIRKCIETELCTRVEWGMFAKRAKDAYQGFLKIEYDRGKCFTLIDYGVALTGLGDYKLAQKTIEQALKIGQRLSFKPEIAKAYYSLARNSEMSGRYQNALLNYKKWRVLRDSIRNDERDKQFAKQEIQFKTLEKDNQLKDLALENESKTRQQVQQLFGFILATLFLLGGGYIFYSRYKLKKQNELTKFQETVNTAMARFVPTAFLKALGRDDIIEVQLGDQVEKEVTVMFSDIRDFTTISEAMTPKENFDLVAEYAGRMGPIVEKHGGFVNQYMGDGILAIYDSGPTQALKSCIAMQKEIQKFNMELKNRGIKPIKVGMGLHKGPLIMGIIGDDKRRDATLISDAVNSAARIESATKQYKCDILVSGDVEEEVEGFDFQRVGEINVKGKTQSIEVFLFETGLC